MNIKKCAWCGKAIYGDDYYVGTGGYYHKDCQTPVWREEEAERMEANKRLANQQYINYVREGE